MSHSLFDVVCPACGGHLALVDAGEAWCSLCAQGFLLRMGHLVPVAPPQPSSAHWTARSS